MDFASVLELGYFDYLCIVLLFYVIYKLFFKKAPEGPPPPKISPPLKKQDLTTAELKKFNGIEDEHICLAVLGDVRHLTSFILYSSKCFRSMMLLAVKAFMDPVVLMKPLPDMMRLEL